MPKGVALSLSLPPSLRSRALHAPVRKTQGWKFGGGGGGGRGMEQLSGRGRENLGARFDYGDTRQ